MSSIVPFRPQTKVYAIDLTTSASTAIQIAPPAGSSNASYTAYLVTNPGADTVSFNFGTDSTTTVTKATNGSPQSGNVILAGSAATFSGPTTAWISALIATGTTTIYVQGGEGL